MARPEVTGRAPGEVAQTKKRNRRLRGPPSLAFTIQEFCDAHRLSRSKYYELKKLGLAPAETRVLDKIIITFESAAAWRRRHTAKRIAPSMPKSATA
jgi:hypothetical protein